MPASTELPRLVPATERRLADPKETSRLLDGDDLRKIVALAAQHGARLANVDQRRQPSVASGLHGERPSSERGLLEGAAGPEVKRGLEGQRASALRLDSGTILDWRLVCELNSSR